VRALSLGVAGAWPGDLGDLLRAPLRRAPALAFSIASAVAEQIEGFLVLGKAARSPLGDLAYTPAHSRPAGRQEERAT